MALMSKRWMLEPGIRIIKGGFLGSPWAALDEKQGASLAQRPANCTRKALSGRRRVEKYLISPKADCF